MSNDSYRVFECPFNRVPERGSCRSWDVPVDGGFLSDTAAVLGDMKKGHVYADYSIRLRVSEHANVFRLPPLTPR